VTLYLLVGRLFLGGFFIYNGIYHFTANGMMTEHARMKGVPFPAFAQAVTGLMLLLGGASIAFGIYPRAGILLLVGFLVPVSYVMHKFWTINNRQLRTADRISFMKNVALVGALLMLLAIPSPWALSLLP
jgi:uncharacterized membrane protein YphA (DoxX/SURF4 family)